MSADSAPAEPDESKNKEAENLWQARYLARFGGDIVGTDAVASGPTFKRDPARLAEEVNIVVERQL
jgi:hypothetical protein